MRIENLESKEPVYILGLALTRAEAQELRDDLGSLLAADEARHEHVSSADYQTQLTVWIADRRRPIGVLILLLVWEIGWRLRSASAVDPRGR